MVDNDHEELDPRAKTEDMEMEELLKEFPHLKQGLSFMTGPMNSNLSKSKGQAFVYKLKKQEGTDAQAKNMEI